MTLQGSLRLTAACVLAFATAQASAAVTGVGSLSGQTWTGNAEVDFPSSREGVLTLVNPRYPTTGALDYINQNNMSSGWAVKDIRLMYDNVSDTLYVGLNFFGIAGDADGNGNPGTVSPAAAAKGALDVPNLGGRESVTVGFYMTGGTRPDYLAGVPQNKQQAGSGLIGFNFAPYRHLSTGLAQSYGATMTNHLGELMFNPSAEHPDFIFTVRNFSQLPGYDPENGFGLVVYAGSPDDTYAEEGALFPRVAFGLIPEPATLVGWSFIAAGACWRIHARRRRRTSQG